jgi:uncharacterized protein (TIGR03435 family)
MPVLAMLLAASSFAQTIAQSPRVEFEVASVKPSAASGPNEVAVGVHVDGAQIQAAGLSIRNLIGLAYRIKAPLIFGPDWIASERFDISATLPAGSTTAQLPEMFQALLADRFQMKVHRDKKELPVYALVAGKGPLKLKESLPNPDADKDEPKGTANVSAGGSAKGVGINFGHGVSFTFANNQFVATKMTMAMFAENLERFADRPIVDETGLTGQYDFTIDFIPEEYRIMLIRSAVQTGANLRPQALRLLDNASPAALGDALQQIGLRLDPRKAPLDVLVIDGALKTPTAN